MKKTFLTILPLVAAVILAASCGDDKDNEPELQPASEPVVSVEETNTVVIPFRVGVESGESLSKIAYETKDGSETQVTRKFEASDVNTSMTVTGDGITESTLTLKQDEESKAFYFEGDITVDSESAESFKNGGITLTGSFGTAVESAQSSTTSLADLMSNCSHAYTSTFASNATSITFRDQNSYLAVTWTNKGNAKVKINDKEYDLNSDGKIWIALPAGTSVTSTDLGITEAKTTKAGTVHKISREYNAVQSVTITGAPTGTKVWGNPAFTISASVAPENASNPNVTWTVTQGSATLAPKGTNNSQCDVLIKGNTTDIKIKATVDGVSSSEVTISVDKNYVDLGTGSVYWKTSDESGTYTFADAKSMGAPAKDVFETLWTQCTVNGTTFTNQNDSGASITLTQGVYWSSSEYDSYAAWLVYVDSGDPTWHGYDSRTDEFRVRLVRAQ